MINVCSGDIIIDLGANIGEVTSFFSRHKALVLCFEPNPYAYEHLSKRFEKYKNVKCYNKAVVGDKNKSKVKLFLHERAEEDQIKFSTGSSIIIEKNNVSKNSFFEVDSINFLDLVKSVTSTMKKNIKLVKMDVEGAEVEILENLLVEEELLGLIENMVVETHEKKIPELKDRMERIRKIIKDRKIDNINLNWI